MVLRQENLGSKTPHQRVRGFCILTFSGAITRRPKLFEAAVGRITELRNGGDAPIVFCAAPLIMAGALLKRGFSTVAMTAQTAMPQLLEITELGGIPVIEGGQHDAIAAATAIGAAKVIVYTESPGVMSADPERIEGAVPVRYVSHVELMELAEQRATAVTKDAAREASIQGLHYEIRDVTDNSRTLVRPDGYEGRLSPITAITVSAGYAFVVMRPRNENKVPWGELQMRILERLAGSGISIEMFQSFSQSLRFLVPSNRVNNLREIAAVDGFDARIAAECAKLCIVGTGVRSVAGVFYRSLAALTKSNIPVLHWSDSNVTLSFVVNENFSRAAERALHETLAPGSEIAVGAPVSFDVDLGVVRVNGEEKRLGSRQAQLLRHLIDNVGRVIEAEELAQQLFGSDGKEELAAVRVHLHNLRKKIEEDPYNPRYIVTVPNQGYVFVR